MTLSNGEVPLGTGASSGRNDESRMNNMGPLLNA